MNETHGRQQSPEARVNEPKGEKKRREPQAPTERSVKQNEKIGKKNAGERNRKHLKKRRQ